MPTLRESAFLPTIKCSSCGLQVEISLMGEHLCAGPSVELSPPPDNSEKFESLPYNPAFSEKLGRLPGPVDTAAANRTYGGQGQLTPVSQPGNSRNASPISPGRPSFAEQARDYFVGGPSRENGTASQSQPGSDGGSFRDRSSGSTASEASSSAPGKPIGLMERMNNIAPGPFNAKRQPSGPSNAFLAGKEPLTILDGPLLEEPGRAADRPGTSHSGMSMGSNGMPSTPRQPKKFGYEGFGPPSNANREAESNVTGSISRSETYPKVSAAVEEPLRRPSYPSLKSPRKSPPINDGERRPSIGPDTSRRPPPRKSLMPQGLSKHAVDLAAEFGASNPYHTPTDSASSGYSNISQSQSSSPTSPARSETREKTEDADKTKVRDGMEVLKISQPEKPRPAQLHLDPATQLPLPARSPAPYTPTTLSPRYEYDDDNFHDPAIQYGIGQTWKAYNPSMGSRYSEEKEKDKDVGPKNEPSPGRTNTTPQRSPPVRQDSRDGNQGSRGQCKACREPITGKSISSADGRLTGKYHKACFVCATCSSRFTSAEFYVLDDKPYCEQHYHKLNGSLCGGCGRGIEGQFIQDESNVKHHLDCFCCLDCGRSLSDGYFEVNGKAYCEKDALRRTQPSPAPPVGAMQVGPRGFPAGPRGGGPRGPGPRPFGGPPGRLGPGGPGGPGLRPGLGPSGMKRGGLMPGRLAPGMGARPTMNKRMTKLGNM